MRDSRNAKQIRTNISVLLFLSFLPHADLYLPLWASHNPSSKHRTPTNSSSAQVLPLVVPFLLWAEPRNKHTNTLNMTKLLANLHTHMFKQAQSHTQREREFHLCYQTPSYPQGLTSKSFCGIGQREAAVLS